MIIHTKNKTGFALLYALLVTSITLSASLIVINIIVRQLVTTNIAVRGFIAYAAADDGAKCARFWDLWASEGKGLSDGILQEDDGILPDDSFTAVSAGIAACAGQPIILTDVTGVDECLGNATKQFSLRLSPINRTTAGTISDPYVSVMICSGGSGRIFLSQGWDTGDTNNPRRASKRIRVI